MGIFSPILPRLKAFKEETFYTKHLNTCNTTYLKLTFSEPTDPDIEHVAGFVSSPLAMSFVSLPHPPSSDQLCYAQYELHIPSFW